jgi:alkylated DNA repair dioxygenase AlkB
VHRGHRKANRTKPMLSVAYSTTCLFVSRQRRRREIMLQSWNRRGALADKKCGDQHELLLILLSRQYWEIPFQSTVSDTNGAAQGSCRVSSKPKGTSVRVRKQVVGCLSWRSDAFSRVEPALPLRYLQG